MWFITRIELHKATHDDYEVLHAAMEDQGFIRAIDSDSGVWYHLPTAEYYRYGNFSIEEVLREAKAAASSVGRAFGAIVTQSPRMMWCNLEKV